MHNIFIEPGHYEFTWVKERAKGIQAEEGLFQEFNDFNIKVLIYLVPLLKQHNCFNIHQLEYDNNKLDMDLRQRINYINANCGKYGDDLVISIHANYNNNPCLKGLDLFYGSENGKKLCELLIKHSKDNLIKYRTMFQCKFDTWTEYGIVLRVEPVSILIEAGYFSNKNDRLILRKAEYHKQIAISIYKSICEFFNIQPISKNPIESWKMIEVEKAVKYGFIDNDDWANDIDGFMPRWAVFEMLNDLREDYQVKIDYLYEILNKNNLK